MKTPIEVVGKINSTKNGTAWSLKKYKYRKTIITSCHNRPMPIKQPINSALLLVSCARVYLDSCFMRLIIESKNQKKNN